MVMYKGLHHKLYRFLIQCSFEKRDAESENIKIMSNGQNTVGRQTPRVKAHFARKFYRTYDEFFFSSLSYAKNLDNEIWIPIYTRRSRRYAITQCVGNSIFPHFVMVIRVVGLVVVCGCVSVR